MADMKITSLTVGDLAENCWFLVNEETKDALIFDPGDEAEKMEACAVSKGWSIQAILLTHGHADHIGGAEELRQRTGAKIYALAEEESTLLDGKKNLSAYLYHRVITVKADEFLKDGQILSLAGVTLQVLHTPGHTPGGCSYYCKEAGCVFVGDTLFRESVGRSDFPGGSMSQLVRSVKEKLFKLPENTRVLTGHGEETSIEYEKRYNPYLT
jgi:glyoxylase-like metal-dependent hydrolase (beta-lactamase superfamily II)